MDLLVFASFFSTAVPWTIEYGFTRTCLPTRKAEKSVRFPGQHGMTQFNCCEVSNITRGGGSKNVSQQLTPADTKITGTRSSKFVF